MVDFNSLINKAAQTEDQSETKNTQEFEYTPPPAGVTIGRFIGYIELGKQPQRPFQGKAKPPADSVRLVFELLHPKKNIRTIEQDGQPVEVTDVIGFTVVKKLGEKAKFKKIFDKMRYGRPMKHMAQMLGEAFIFNVHHNEHEKDGKKVVYANLNDGAGEYHIRAPFSVDPITEQRTDVPVPAARRPMQLFLFDNPTRETWDSLFIDGTREVKQGAQVVQVSRNWLQEVILGATNYQGSPLHAMLGNIADLPISEMDPGAAHHDDSMAALGALDVPTPAAEKPVQPVSAPAATPAAPPVKSAADDALAALGLVA